MCLGGGPSPNPNPKHNPHAHKDETTSEFGTDLCWQWLPQYVWRKKNGAAPGSCCPALGGSALPPALPCTHIQDDEEGEEPGGKTETRMLSASHKGAGMRQGETRETEMLLKDIKCICVYVTLNMPCALAWGFSCSLVTAAQEIVG